MHQQSHLTREKDSAHGSIGLQDQKISFKKCIEFRYPRRRRDHHTVFSEIQTSPEGVALQLWCPITKQVVPATVVAVLPGLCGWGVRGEVVRLTRHHTSLETELGALGAAVGRKRHTQRTQGQRSLLHLYLFAACALPIPPQLLVNLSRYGIYYLEPTFHLQGAPMCEFPVHDKQKTLWMLSG